MKKTVKSNNIIDYRHPDCHIRAAEVIKSGGVVAIPTETYYGLAVDPFNESALCKLFLLKKRPTAKPLLVIIDDIKRLSLLTNNIPELYQPLIKKYWPGALTLLFPALPEISPVLTSGSGTIGVRITSHETGRKICELLQQPITATSANVSGYPPAATAEAVVETFGERVDLIINDNVHHHGKCSTVVGIENDILALVRDGSVPIEDMSR